MQSYEYPIAADDRENVERIYAPQFSFFRVHKTRLVEMLIKKKIKRTENVKNKIQGLKLSALRHGV